MEGLSVTDPIILWAVILLVIGWGVIAPIPDPPPSWDDPFPFPYPDARNRQWCGYSSSTDRR